MSRNGREGSFHYKKSLGQNFIYDEALLRALADASGVGAQDSVLEIGAGAGSLTKQLAARCARVLAVEIDDAVLPLLRLSISPFDNVTVLQTDALRLDFAKVHETLGAYHVVANIPYYITTPLLEMLLCCAYPPQSISVMVQSEVTARLLAKPSTPEYSPLALRVQYAYAPRVALSVPAACFTPPPKVDSAFVVMPRLERPSVETEDEKLLFRIIDAAFVIRRKTLVNNLMPAFSLSREHAQAWLSRAGIRPDARGEALTLEEFANLARCKA